MSSTYTLKCGCVALVELERAVTLCAAHETQHAALHAKATAEHGAARDLFYVWHGEGCCDNKCDSLEEARSIAAELRKDHTDVYVVDANDQVQS